MAHPKRIHPKSLANLLRKADGDLSEIFPYLAGERVPTMALADIIGDALGVSATSLTKPVTRLRPRVLDMFAAATGMTPGTVWGVFTGRRRLGIVGAQKFERATGIPLAHWLEPERYPNWLIEYVQGNTASGRRAAKDLAAKKSSEGNGKAA